MSDDKQTDDKFETSDLSLCAFLHLRRHCPTESRIDQFDRISFAFPKTEQLIKDVFSFQSGEGDFLSYYQALSYYRGLILECRKDSGHLQKISGNKLNSKS